MPCVLRIIDANANRAREALRVMEEAARFVLDDAPLSETIKQLRHDLAVALSRIDALDANRDTPGDVGTHIATASEASRASVADVAAAAGKRLSEALRAIEEYSKTVNTDVAAAVEQLRYRGYDIEQRLGRALATGRATQWTLCVLVSESLCPGGDWLKVARAAVDGGADCIQLREKQIDGGELLDRTRRLIDVCRPKGAAVILNDRPDIALLAGADGVHVGQTDLPCAEVRRLVGRQLLVGVGTSMLDEAQQARIDGADYCGVGPMFPTTTKRKDVIVGPPYLKQYVAWGKLPHLAIAGITPDNIDQLIAVGVRGVAVSSVICGADDPAAVAGRFDTGFAPPAKLALWPIDSKRVVILPVAIAGLAFVTHFGHYTKSTAFDFYQFWMFGQAAHQSAPANIYDAAERTRIGEAFYQRALGDELSKRHRDVAQQRREPQAVSSPLMYALFGVCSGGNFELDYINFQLLAAVSVAVAVLLLGRGLGYSWPVSCLWFGALLTWFGPFFSDVEVGNVNRMQLLLIGMYVWLQTRGNLWARDLVGGVVLSAMITFKPNLALVPVLLVVTWLITADFGRLLRQLAGMAAGIVAAVAFAAWYFGDAACWTNWLRVLRDTTQNMQTHNSGNVSFAWWLTGRLGVSTWLGLTAGLSLVVLIAAAIGRRGRHSAPRAAMIVAAAVAIALLGSPLTWHHYLVLAAPLWLIMLMPDAPLSTFMRWVGIAVLIGFGVSRLMIDFAGIEQSYDLLKPIWWLSIALPLVVIITALARPRDTANLPL